MKASTCPFELEMLPVWFRMKSSTCAIGGSTWAGLGVGRHLVF